MDSSSLGYGKFALGPGPYRGWVLRMQAVLLTFVLAGGWVGRGGPVRRDAAADVFWKVGKPAPIAVREGLRDRSGRDAGLDVGIPGCGLCSLAVARSVPDPAHGKFRQRCLDSGTGR